jgi:hypothetical protein
MESPEPKPVTTFKSRGVPGAAVRSRGFSQALYPFIGLVFVSGWAFGALLPFSFLHLSHAAILLMVLAFGIWITWKRAVHLLARHEEGARGEEKVARVLEALPEGWKVYHGVPLSGKNMDHVVVSPGQLFLIETVNWPGNVRLVDHCLHHGGEAYEGYDVESLLGRADAAAEALNIPRKAVAVLVCIVGGRFNEHPGDKQGVWIGEIQDMGPFLLQHQGAGLDAPLRVAVLETLETLIEQEEPS